MYFRYFDFKSLGGIPPSPVAITTGRPSTSLRYATPIASPSHMGGDNAPTDMLPIIIGNISRTGGMNFPLSLSTTSLPLTLFSGSSSAGKILPRSVLTRNSCRPASRAGSVSIEILVNLSLSRVETDGSFLLPPLLYPSPPLFLKCINLFWGLYSGSIASFGHTSVQAPHPVQYLSMSVTCSTT